jgi:hypothetical protein
MKPPAAVAPHQQVIEFLDQKIKGHMSNPSFPPKLKNQRPAFAKGWGANPISL